ncbi:hypothetical protein C3F36_12990 [Aeromonas sp. ASNIH2]|nr:hypothetical protein C3F36_12990 [Aeromonas sp. ASNIH2]
MQGHRIGYVRVSSFDQNPERQLEQTQVSKVFTDKASGKDTQRPQLEALLSFVREGDTVVVHSMDRLARNLDDLRRLVQKLTQRGVRIEFLKEGLVFTGEDSPMANLMLSVMGAFAEFERALIREQQRYRASGLNLVTAAIVLWNTVYLERATQGLVEAGKPRLRLLPANPAFAPIDPCMSLSLELFGVVTHVIGNLRQRDGYSAR